MTFWGFLDNFTKYMVMLLVLLLCTPLGWIGLLLIAGILKILKG
jgi:hypothetical protein